MPWGEWPVPRPFFIDDSDANEAPPSFALKVYGCQMNVYDGDRMRRAMTLLGWKEADEPEEADCVIFMTCSIRDKAEQKVLSELGRFRSQWMKKRKPYIALLGCMAQRTGRTVVEKFPWVKIVAGPRSLGAVPSSIARSFFTDAPVFFHLDDDPTTLNDLTCAPESRLNPHKAFVTISHGCDQFCSYCIVPYVRGRFGSKAPDRIMQEISALLASGIVEITLLGQNVNTYGRDLKGYRFANLLKDVAGLPGLRRLRFTTSHPIDFTDDILEAMSTHSDVICPSINLPVQAGSDKVLREMNRKYTRDEFLSVIERIRKTLPEVGLTTDLIVGFPGETVEEFLQSVSLLELVRFDLVHSAAYSPREGTPAAAREDRVSPKESARRLVQINELQTGISMEINRSLIGKTVEVLIDEPAEKGAKLMQGRTATDKVVLLKATEEMRGEFRRAKITEASPWCLTGEILR